MTNGKDKYEKAILKVLGINADDTKLTPQTLKRIKQYVEKRNLNPKHSDVDLEIFYEMMHRLEI